MSPKNTNPPAAPQGSEDTTAGQQGQPAGAEPPAAAQPPAPDEPDGNAQQQQQEDGNREAANYRRQLRDTEQERDGLNDAVEALRRQLVSRSMPSHSAISAAALWSTGRNAADFFNEDGQLDTALLHGTVKEVREQLGVEDRRGIVPASGTGSGGTDGSPTTLAGEIRRKKE